MKYAFSPIHFFLGLSLLSHSWLVFSWLPDWQRSNSETSHSSFNVHIEAEVSAPRVSEPEPQPKQPEFKKSFPSEHLVKNLAKNPVQNTTGVQPKPSSTQAPKPPVITTTAKKSGSGIPPSERDRILNKIESLKRYPVAAYRRGITGRTMLLLKINSRGEILELSCERGHTMLCEAALNTVQTAAPFELSGNAGNGIEQKITIRFGMDYLIQ